MDELDSLFYIGTADTALAIGRRLLNYKFILHIRELYDTHPYYIKKLKLYAPHALKVIVPEDNRAAILRSWLNLSVTPTVLPNRPISHPGCKNIMISDSFARRIIEDLKGKKILLYQGHVGLDRGLEPLVTALNHISDDYVLILMGKNHDDCLSKLLKISERIIHIPYIPAPRHLEITSYAHIGIVSYDFSSLNNIFCAPNKIWEYAGFGIPILGNDVPGLKYSIGECQAGLCANFNDIASIASKINQIEVGYEHFF